MVSREEMLGRLLGKIADEINITKTMQEKAVSSYEAVGKWIGDGLDFDIKIMPQGSMNLGTVIKPLDDSDEYDMDLVCLLQNGQSLSLYQIKNLVGNRLKANEVYKRMLEKEGKRCWTMQYDEFHVDILPCIPQVGTFKEPTDTAITLTHKIDDGKYESRPSNPYAYHMWFENRMKEILLREKREFASMNNTEISKVPTYKMRTPLQKVVQLLKRHRDICFQNDSEYAPISIIITTLATLAYSGETNIYEALCGVLKGMPQYIECRNGVYWIANPVMSDENFADKWNIEPQKRVAFTNWLNKAQKELTEDPLSCYGIDAIADKYNACLGIKPVQRALNSLGTETQVARQNQHLFVDGITGGLTYSSSQKSKPVKEHTFFGE